MTRAEMREMDKKYSKATAEQMIEDCWYWYEKMLRLDKEGTGTDQDFFALNERRCRLLVLINRRGYNAELRTAFEKHVDEYLKERSAQ